MDIIKLDSRLTDEDFQYKSEMAAGVDLRACRIEEDELTMCTFLYPNVVFKIGSGICVDMRNSGMCAIVLPRSSTGTAGVSLANTIGLIDPDYQGEIIMAIKNTSNDLIRLDPLERIAQLVFFPILRPTFNFVESFHSETERGSGGFGSTGSS